MICLTCGNDMDKISSTTYECMDCKGSYELEFNDESGEDEWVFYEYDSEGEEDYIYESVYSDVPVGCSACGGEYPNCKEGCPMFD